MLPVNKVRLPKICNAFNVDNTADVEKPVSKKQRVEIDLLSDRIDAIEDYGDRLDDVEADVLSLDGGLSVANSNIATNTANISSLTAVYGVSSGNAYIAGGSSAKLRAADLVQVGGSADGAAYDPDVGYLAVTPGVSSGVHGSVASGGYNNTGTFANAYTLTAPTVTTNASAEFNVNAPLVQFTNANCIMRGSVLRRTLNTDWTPSISSMASFMWFANTSGITVNLPDPRTLPGGIEFKTLSQLGSGAGATTFSTAAFGNYIRSGASNNTVSTSAQTGTVGVLIYWIVIEGYWVLWKLN